MESSQTKSPISADPNEAVSEGNLTDSSQKPIEQLEEDVQAKLSIQQNEQKKTEQIQQMSKDFVHLTRDPLLALQAKLFELQ